MNVQPRPGDTAASAERATSLPPGGGERYVGYGLMGVAFATGDVLALRRFPLGSRGCGYTAVWHRRPDGAWTFYTDATCDQGCTSHFAPSVERLVVAPIRIEWHTPWQVSVSVDGGREIAWTTTLAPSWPARVLSHFASRLPEWCWRNRTTRGLIQIAAALWLGAGRLRLAGRLPSQAQFDVRPRSIWVVRESRALVRGESLGAMTYGPPGLRLGDFIVPRRPLMAAGPLVITPGP